MKANTYLDIEIVQAKSPLQAMPNHYEGCLSHSLYLKVVLVKALPCCKLQIRQTCSISF